MSNVEECENCLNNLMELKNDLMIEYDKVDTEQLYYSGSIKEFDAYKKILSKLKYRQMISTEEVKIIVRFLHEQKIDKKTIVNLCEQIRVFSKDVNNKFDRNFDKFSFLNILKSGFEKFPDIHIENKNEIVNKAKSLLQLSKSYSENINEFTEQLPTFSESNMTIEEYKCLYVEIMKQIQKDIKSVIDNACDDEFYMDKEVKQIIMNEYNDNVKLYNVVRNHFDNEIDYLKHKLQSNDEVDEKEIQTNITFLVSDDDEKTFLERDLKDIRHEKLEDLKYLLIGKKYNSLSKEEDKTLVSNDKFKGFDELKTDQIRIIYKKLNNNNIVILGAAEKKKDIDAPMLSRLINRYRKYYIEELQNRIDHNEIFNRISDYCMVNQRKGTR